MNTEEHQARTRELKTMRNGMIFAIVIVSLALVNVAVLYRRMPGSDLVMQLLLAGGLLLLAGLLWYFSRVRRELRSLRS